MTKRITLATLPQATAQEVFDQVATHLLTQMAVSREGSVGSRCLYRSPTGLACAAGCLIADDEYDPVFDTSGDGTSWGGLIYADMVPNTHQGLVGELQDVHDQFSPNEWLDELRAVAECRGLNTTVLEKFK